MSGKNLTFKLIMEGDNKGLVASAKQSEQVVSKVFETIKQEAEQVRASTNTATEGIDQLGKESVTVAGEVKKLDSELGQTNTELKETGVNAKSVSAELGGLKTGFNAITGALAALGIGATAQEIAQTADEYKNLSGRIRIAIGEHGNLEKAMDDVKNIAIATNSNLTATGDLFSRLTKIGQEAKWSQEQVLSLTETINKAIQVGGGSAASNEAAITQLNQALGSGVLRGDEFNSMMEQSPRLAQALADGLGVTTGKLRELAGEGKLTTDVVTKALLSQSEKINTEFAKFPATIGASIENLKTAWTVYIGEADAASGVSEKVANAIKYVAENLDSIVSTLTLVGQAFIAYKALNIANVFLDKAAGVRAASMAITQETAAVVANTQAQLTNAAATRSTAAAKAQFAANSKVAATSAATTGGSIMTLVGRLGALGVAITAIGVLIPTVFEPIGTWIGEGVAKLQGYGDALEKLEKQTQLEETRAKVAADVKASFAAATEKAREKTYQLTEESKKLITTFNELIAKGESVSDALKKISESMKFDSTKGINNSITALYMLRDQGKITADELSASIKQAMSDKDLLVFATNAQAAFRGTAFEAQKMALVAEQAMILAVERTGFSFDQLKGQGSTASRSLINDVMVVIQNLDNLKDQGVDTGLALNASFSNAIKGAETEQQLSALRGQVEKLKGELGTTVSGGLLAQISEQSRKLANDLDVLKAGINSVNEAYSILGLQSKDEAQAQAKAYQDAYNVILKSGKATTGELRQALQKMSADVYASGDAATKAWYEAQLGLQGMKVELDGFGQASTSLEETNKAIQNIGYSARNSANDLREMNSAKNDESSSGGDDYWDAFKKKMSDRVAKSNEAAQARRSSIGGVKAPIGTDSALASQPVIPDAPMIASGFDIKSVEGVESKQTVEIKIDMGTGQTATVNAAPDQADTLKTMMQELEKIKRSS